MFLSANTSLEVMFNKISNLNNDISTKLMENVKCCVEERLNKDVMSLLRSLNDVENFIEQLSNDAKSVNLSLQDELNLLLQKDGSTIAVGGQDSFNGSSPKSQLFRNSGQRNEKVQKLNNAILYIKPTSLHTESFFGSVRISVQN
ncbi:hypothetical protein ACJMK2_007713 [Sinanodonta woodiana]|uniref:Uncharacterized protein n=1 Tax=Sinanodonta woodiana TaxID=1069815 RepID=A0ABD3VJD1_SINWO